MNAKQVPRGEVEGQRPQEDGLRPVRPAPRPAQGTVTNQRLRLRGVRFAICEGKFQSGVTGSANQGRVKYFGHRDRRMSFLGGQAETFTGWRRHGLDRSIDLLLRLFWWAGRRSSNCLLRKKTRVASTRNDPT